MVIGRRRSPTETFAAEYGFAHNGTDLFKALSDSRVDAVFLCTPSPQHASQAQLVYERASM